MVSSTYLIKSQWRRGTMDEFAGSNGIRYEAVESELQGTGSRSN
jgi:hypothetical protein